MALVLIYLIFWAGIALYFSYADRYKTQLESSLSTVFDRPVQIGSINTVWDGLSPKLKISNLNIQGDSDNDPVFAFDSLSAKVNPLSLLALWPTFTEFDVQKPVLDITSYADGSLQIAGITLGSKQANTEFSQRTISWLLDQKSASWQDGLIVWRKEIIGDREFSEHRYKNISMAFDRQQQNRKLQADVLTPKGSLAFIAKTNGDLLSANNWDASLEVLGNKGKALLTPEEFSISVNNGQGKVLLKTLNVERILDFIRLSGLASDARWLLEAKVMGRLHDVNFNFSGPLLNVKSWNLSASASDIGFKSVGRAPAMNNLSGQLNASRSGGDFIFAADDSLFEWSKWYSEAFLVKRAVGEFSWRFNNDARLLLSLKHGEFEDKNTRITDLFLSTDVDYKANKISNFADLFKVKSVDDLSFEGDQLVYKKLDEQEQAKIIVDAKANFEVFDLSQVDSYFPSDKRLVLFLKWAEKGFAAGQVSNGKFHYKGELAKSAIDNGTASLDASADFDNVIIDYAPEQNWPAAKRGKGKAILKNQLLTITPSEVWINGDPATDGTLMISSLFKKERTLSISANTKTSLVKGVDFLFKGPLIKPENQLSDLPITPLGGTVDINIDVAIVLSDISNAKVKGSARVVNGHGLLTGNVPISDVNGLVNFTERSVASDNVRATFLGGETKGKLITLKEAQPPVVKLIASGAAQTEALKPWIGEHILTWFAGVAPWQGSMTVDDGKVDIVGESQLQGVAVMAPAPLKKGAQEPAKFTFGMTVGNEEVAQTLSISYKDELLAQFKANAGNGGSFFDNSLISIGSGSAAPLKPGINFLIEKEHLNLDDWLSAVIDLASYETESTESIGESDTLFMDSMRSITVSVKDPVLLGYKVGELNATAMSVDGLYWIGTLDGENVDGTMQLQPRDTISHYGFNLDYLNLSQSANDAANLEPVDYSLSPSSFPSLSLNIENFRFEGKDLGQLKLLAKPVGQEWQMQNMTLLRNGTRTEASGSWKNSKIDGSLTSLAFESVVDEAEGAFNDMDFAGVIRKGNGAINGELSWLGAPHEFTYERLNGRFDASLKEGELVQIEPGSGKLLGLFNFNAIARRLVFDFRDVFASGLQFDRMRFAGVLADGEVIFTDAFIFSPAVFVRMEGKIDLAKELVDMEMHISPELGGNIALLSALANPAAGAVVFITQRLFKDEMRNANFKSYRALGSWEDFEMLEMKDGEVLEQQKAKSDEVSTDQNEASIESRMDSREGNNPEALSLEKLDASPIKTNPIKTKKVP